MAVNSASTRKKGHRTGEIQATSCASLKVIMSLGAPCVVSAAGSQAAAPKAAEQAMRVHPPGRLCRTAGCAP
ncbi:hypothetical protein GCM10007320_37330 [Pseudorhodoferax aquiterrae]|uniref:Uncharacterized protein n=1 Tax=Pseudorhodoferax aquiterrae TaxID=747304 RepID=A0ABQ3G4P9_9BURK|nr:hypothetical protein GCM10007320_37330 [Pseudorhodoferax aquiterrae]